MIGILLLPQYKGLQIFVIRLQYSLAYDHGHECMSMYVLAMLATSRFVCGALISKKWSNISTAKVFSLHGSVLIW